MKKKQQLLKRVEKVIESGRKAKTNQGRSQIDSIMICTEGYAEPGYDQPASGIVAFGNWNDVTRYDGHEFHVIDDAPGRVAKLLESLNVELDWSDEWCQCDGCHKAVRTQANSYRWRPSYADDGCGSVLCHECLKADPSGYLRSLEGSSNRCVTIADLDLEANGYKLLADDFENGLYDGQSDRPELIAEALRQQGVERFIFNLDSTGQFDIAFSVWVHESQFALIDTEEFEAAPTAGVDPAVMLQKALGDASRQMDQIDGQIKVASCDLSTGRASVKVVSAQDFIEGRALDS